MTIDKSTELASSSAQILSPNMSSETLDRKAVGEPSRDMVSATLNGAPPHTWWCSPKCVSYGLAGCVGGCCGGGGAAGAGAVLAAVAAVAAVVVAACGGVWTGRKSPASFGMKSISASPTDTSVPLQRRRPVTLPSLPEKFPREDRDARRSRGSSRPAHLPYFFWTCASSAPARSLRSVSMEMMIDFSSARAASPLSTSPVAAAVAAAANSPAHDDALVARAAAPWAVAQHRRPAAGSSLPGYKVLT